MPTLHGKVIVVTGSTTGIGEAIARQCVSDGARVLIHGRDEERGRALVDELGADRAVLHLDDLADPDAPQRLIDAAVAAFGTVHGLCNNAAWVVRSRLSSTSAEMFDKVMAINVRAPMLLIRAALPLLAANRGCIVNIGSVNALGGESNLLAYSISKGALQTLSRNLADALCRQQVRITHLNVGWVLTDNEYQTKIDDGLGEGWPDRLDDLTIPAGRMTRPEEIARVVAFWLSDDARPFSGTTMELEQYPFAGRNPTKEGPTT